jgi:hypothetical protein
MTLSLPELLAAVPIHAKTKDLSSRIAKTACNEGRLVFGSAVESDAKYLHQSLLMPDTPMLGITLQLGMNKVSLFYCGLFIIHERKCLLFNSLLMRLSAELLSRARWFVA